LTISGEEIQLSACLERLGWAPGGIIFYLLNRGVASEQRQHELIERIHRHCGLREGSIRTFAQPVARRRFAQGEAPIERAICN
jgi:hypothetical protein